MNYNDGKWHGWDGGECPVHPETVVDYVWFDPDTAKICGVTTGRYACDRVAWRQVVRFRVIKEHKEPREFWIDLKPYGDYPVVSHTPMSGSYIHVREVLE